MVYSRLPLKDPRTVARDIPGIFDVIFPQLTAGIVAYFNKKSTSYKELKALPDQSIQASHLNRAMLFEIAFARGEQLLNGNINANWDDCLEVATRRQQRHFDANLPETLQEVDKLVADLVGKNLFKMLTEIRKSETNSVLISSPEIPGYQWISSGEGDFSITDKLIEVKCTNRHFSSADYRQVLMYWLLSYSSAIEKETLEWKSVLLINPRLNLQVDVPFNDLIKATAAGKSKIEVLELFSFIVGDYTLKAFSEYKL